MSADVRPGGGQPRWVFWRRRFVLLGVVLLLAWGATRLLTGREPGPAVSLPPPSSTDSDANSAPAEGKDDGRRARAAQRTDERKAVTVSLGQSYGPCDSDEVMVRPAVPADTYAGSSVPLALAMSTSEKLACTLDLAEARLLVAVVAGDGDDSETVWESGTCPSALPTQVLQLDPTWATTVPMTWSGAASGARCAADARPVRAGDYTIKAAMLGGAAAESEFTLAVRPVRKPPDDKKTPRR